MFSERFDIFSSRWWCFVTTVPLDLEKGQADSPVPRRCFPTDDVLSHEINEELMWRLDW